MKTDSLLSKTKNIKPHFSNPKIMQTLSNPINDINFILDKKILKSKTNQKLKRIKSSSMKTKFLKTDSNTKEIEHFDLKDELKIHSNNHYIKTQNNDKKNEFDDINYNLNTLNTETKSDKLNFDIDHRNNLSIYSTLWYVEEPKKQKTYYYINNKKKEKRYKDILKKSEYFNKYNSERFILGKINKYKNQCIGINDFKKFQQISYKKRIPLKVAFGKGKSNNLNTEIINNHDFNKRLKQQKKRKILLSKQLNDLYKNGPNLNKDFKLINNYQKSTSKSSPKNLFIIDSFLNKLQTKDSFGKEIYSVLSKHQILKNILPKEVDYNTKTSIEDIINNEIHPLLIFQKKFLAQNSNLISQDLNILFGRFFRLSEMHNKHGEAEEKLDLKINEKFFGLMKTLLERKKTEEEKIDLVSNHEDKDEKIERRKYLLNKFKDVIILAYQKIKKFNIDINIFYSLMDYNKNDANFQMELILKGQYLFKAIKARDIREIIKCIDNYKYLVAYKDDFNQTPLHICAKRNLYQLIHFLLSRLSSIDSQDLGGRTPLMIAAKNNCFEFVTILLFEGADPKIKDFSGKLASEMTTIYNIKVLLRRAEILYHLRYFIKGKNFMNYVYNGLDFLFKKELEIDYEEWIKEGHMILKEIS